MSRRVVIVEAEEPKSLIEMVGEYWGILRVRLLVMFLIMGLTWGVLLALGLLVWATKR